MRCLGLVEFVRFSALSSARAAAAQSRHSRGTVATWKSTHFRTFALHECKSLPFTSFCDSSQMLCFPCCDCETTVLRLCCNCAKNVRRKRRAYRVGSAPSTRVYLACARSLEIRLNSPPLYSGGTIANGFLGRTPAPP